MHLIVNLAPNAKSPAPVVSPVVSSLLIVIIIGVGNEAPLSNTSKTLVSPEPGAKVKLILNALTVP